MRELERLANVSKEGLARRDLAIALSGGGSRSAAFAIGAMDCLLERNLLSRVKVISSSSGGCLVNAAIAKAMWWALANDGSEEQRVRYELDRLFRRLIIKGFSPYTAAVRSVFGALGTLVSVCVVIFMKQDMASSFCSLSSYLFLRSF